ncbi:MAG: Rab family GTPase [Promethearchaeota archaeon]
MLHEEKPRYLVKICLLGQGGVGKTCLTKRLCFDTFDINTKLTIGLDFYTYDLPISVNDEETFVRLSVWDFGGQEQFKSLFSYYIGGANGIFMVFSLVNLQTLINLDWWYDQLDDSNLTTSKMIIGTKSDLVNEESEKYQVDNLIMKQFMKKHDEHEFFKTSSKEGYNIKQCFKELVKRILEQNKLEYDKFL